MTDDGDGVIGREARQAWFADNVVATPLQLGGRQVRVMLHDWLADGSFYASLLAYVEFDVGRIAHSNHRWKLPHDGDIVYWSDSGFRWFLRALDDFSELIEGDQDHVKQWLQNEPNSQT